MVVPLRQQEDLTDRQQGPPLQLPDPCQSKHPAERHDRAKVHDPVGEVRVVRCARFDQQYETERVVLRHLAHELAAGGAQACDGAVDAFDREQDAPSPSAFGGAIAGWISMSVGLRNFVSSTRPCPSGVRIITMSTWTLSIALMRSTHWPSIGALPSIVMPSAVKKAIAAARSSTTTLTWSNLLIVMSPGIAGACAAPNAVAVSEHASGSGSVVTPLLSVPQDRAGPRVERMRDQTAARCRAVVAARNAS